MDTSLIYLRLLGGCFGAFLALWSFGRFRNHTIRRSEFFLTSLLGAALVIESVHPDSVNIIAGMLLMEDKQFGRIIMLLLFSNMLLWVLVLNLRGKDAQKSIQFDLLVRKLAQDHLIQTNELKKINDIVVIIPVLNEAENLEMILPRMPAFIAEHAVSILVVDDGSTDATVDVVKRHGYLVVSNPINRGGGAALRLGYDIGVRGGASIVVTMDGDGQHLPEEIARLVEPIIADATDIVIGSRVLGKREKDSVFRWIGIHVFNFIINMLAGTNITDCSNGFRAFRVRSLQRLLLQQDQFHTAELIIDAARKGIRIAEAPVTVLRRHSGESKKGKNLSYGLKFSKTVLKTWLR